MIDFSFPPRGVPALMFHGLCRKVPEYSVFSESRTCLIEEADFVKIIEWISANYDVIRLDDLGRVNTGRWKRKPVLLTFDDALLSVIDIACPVLKQYNMSAVVFVTVDWIDSGKAPDIFQLEKLLWQRVPCDLALKTGTRAYSAVLNDRNDIPAALSGLWNFLFEIRFPPLGLSAAQVSINGRPWDREEKDDDPYFWFPSTWEQLKQAAGDGTLEIGSHMASHTPLQWLSKEEKLFQLQYSHDALSQRTGGKVISCSYPHGLIDEETIGLAEGIYQWGFTNRYGLIDGKTRPGTVPRCHVPGEDPMSIRDVLNWGYKASRIKRMFGR
jgi:peptidoglycan/xylan/chitin deacetylase (PgdA/CDA1 family)